MEIQLPSPPSRLFSRETQAIFFNFKPEPTQRMLDFDYVCKRPTPSIAALVAPGTTEGNHKAFFGTGEILLPCYGSTAQAAKAHPKADVFINYASYRSAFASSKEALEIDTIRVVVIIAEGLPERDTKNLVALAKKKGKVVIGPATVGGIQAGAFKIADTAGTIDNIITCKLYRPGSVGFVSKSGGLSNEMYNILSKTTNGLYEGIAIGGDVFPGSTLSDHVLRFQEIDEIKMVVVLGELGGEDEYGLVELLKNQKIHKPLLAWFSGGCAKMFPQEVQFGHAGARSGSERGSAEAKLTALRLAGAFVPDSFETFPDLIKQIYLDLKSRGVIQTTPDEGKPPVVPIDFLEGFKTGRVRRATGIISSICDDRGDEPAYAGIPISALIEQKSGIGEVIALLWFKRKLPSTATRFIELVLVLVADHGPCVSGAHNTIVAARAGKDLVSCVASGLLTVGPRFGGAIDDAARYFKKAHDNKVPPDVFVENMKNEGKRIPGIGHRIKSANNLDSRVVIMKKYAEENFTSRSYLNYALAVEKITLSKQANLVLNVDGCIAALFLDLMVNCASFSAKEMDEITETGYLNGLFCVGKNSWVDWSCT
eukprot:TRINITY_DN943_c0_g4_i2.p1 TRINITY_DN943_c0_g4~~TRINITY_DN943_c0_g4_i2.p1  ORF type:complete len:622 (-),score=220.36 TRINITY_DN943_c0_g4_i2:323-2110(-)